LLEIANTLNQEK